MKTLPYFLVLVLTACSTQDERVPHSVALQVPLRKHPTALATDSASAAHFILPERLTPQSLSAAEVPAAQRLRGALKEAWRWTDVKGDNLLVVYAIGPLADTPQDGKGAGDAGYLEDENGNTIEVKAYQEWYVQLRARQYVKQQGTYTELWRLQDEIRHCPFNQALALLPGSTAITDLDHDGQTETTLIYTKMCRSDVSPDEMKLILHEGPAKFALRGYNVVQFDSVSARQRQPAEPCCLDKLSKRQLEKAYQATAHGGRYFSEADFKAAPAFLPFARQHWQRFIVSAPVNGE